jgi:type VI secretion system protein ImpL
MGKVLKIVLLAIVAIAVVAGIVFLVLVMHWPWWAGLAIGLGIIGIVLAAIVVKKWLFRKSEKNFVKRVTANDSASMESAGVDKRNLQLLDERWKEAIDALRRSQLKKQGQPLYVLPWYLIMGEAGSGKTAAIKGTRLHSALIDVSQSGGAGTKNCDWWFFEKVIVLDSTGRYTIPIDELQDKAEWHQFLMLLARYRKKEPINGVMVSVGADKLFSSDPDVLADQGRLIRRRIDELMRAFGARFPIFIMVTKIDQIPGMGSFCELLPDEILDQAMGRSTQSAAARPTKHVEDTITYVSELLKELRTLLLQKKPFEDPGALIFPDEIVKLKPTLSRFVETIFERNPYQEPPLLRGIYFCSARQESGDHSLPGVLASFQSALDKGPPTFKGLFLKDFFRKILPEARNLIAPTSEFIRWRKMVRILGLLAWLTVFLFLTGFLTLSFIKNVSTMNAFRSGFARSPKLENEINKDVLLLGQYQRKIVELQSLNKGWFIPRMGLDASLRMEEGLKKEYCDVVRKGLIDRVDQSIADNISGFSRNTSEETVVAYVDHIGNRITMLSEIITGDGLRDEEKIPSTLFSVLSSVDTKLMPDLAGKNILPVYLAFLRWNQNKQLLEQERSRLKDSLKQLALGKGTDLFWLIKWANLQKIAPVRFGDFWSQQIQSEIKEVPPAFTSDGWKQIQGFLKQYEEAVADGSIKDRKIAFETRYYAKLLSQ